MCLQSIFLVTRYIFFQPTFFKAHHLADLPVDPVAVNNVMVYVRQQNAQGVGRHRKTSVETNRRSIWKNITRTATQRIRNNIGIIMALKYLLFEII